MAFVGTSNSSGTTIDPPPGLADGHRLLLLVFGDDGFECTSPGFSQVGSRVGSFPYGVQVLERFFTGAVPENFALTYDFASSRNAVLIALSGRHASTASVAVFTTLTGPGASPLSCTLTGVTAGSGDDILVGAEVVDPDGDGEERWEFAPPADYTEAADLNRAFVSCGVSYRENVSAGATGALTTVATVTVGTDTGSYAGMVIRVPAAAAGSAPTLSLPTPSGTLGTQTTATIGATTTDSTGGTFYAVVDTASLSGITASQIKAGQNAGGGAAIASGNTAVSSTTPSVGVTGLVAGTTYNYACVHNNTTGDSNIVTGSFTTAPTTPASSPPPGRGGRTATLMLT